MIKLRLCMSASCLLGNSGASETSCEVAGSQDFDALGRSCWRGDEDRLVCSCARSFSVSSTTARYQLRSVAVLVLYLENAYLTSFVFGDFAWSQFWDQVLMASQDTRNAAKTVDRESNVAVLFHT
jgi:hypothetical protein